MVQNAHVVFLTQLARDASLETILTSPQLGFGLATASPLQRAICRISTGVPLGELASHPDVIRALGTESIGQAPDELAIVAAIRGGKSLFCAARAVYASQHCDLTLATASEVPRISIVSLSVDLAHVVYAHLVGGIRRSPALRALLAEEPKADSVRLRHLSGRLVEIKVSAGARAGASLVARWSAGVIFDEAPRMLGSDDGAIVNLDDAQKATKGRLLPGAQIIYVGSPWAPFGPVYEMVRDHWLRPTRNLVVVRAPGPALNPVWWTPERCEKLRETDPDAYATDVEARFLSPQSQLFDDETLKRATKRGDVAPEKRASYVAACDPATRGNAWTLAVWTRDGERKRLVLAREWKGSRTEPLDPKDVMRRIAGELAPYNVTMVYADRWNEDSLRSHAADAGLDWMCSTWTEKERVNAYLAFRDAVISDQAELHNHPQIRDDLLHVVKRVTASGLTIQLPTTGDGRHCDFAPAIVLGFSQYCADVRRRELTADERMAAEEAEMERRAIETEQRSRPHRRN
jgi:hypothetical protein